jgi:integrase
MAGTWEKDPCRGKDGTDASGIQRQLDARRSTASKPVWRYRYLYRNADGVRTAWTTPPGVENPHRAVHLKKKDIMRARDEGTLPDPKLARKTLADAFEHLRTTWRKKPSTLAWYESRWQTHVKDARWEEQTLGSRRLRTIKRSELEEFYADLEERTSLATRRSVQQLVSKLFSVAVRLEWVLKDPTKGIEMPGAEPRPARFLDEKEVAAIADKVPPRYRTLVWTLAITGLRVGEACALRVKNLNGSIRVAENSVEVRGVKTLGQPKTAGSERIVPIPPSLRKMLKEHVTTYGNAFDPESFVFTTERGKQVGQGVWRKRVFQPAAVAAKVTPTPRVHDLRHTAASLMLKNGMSVFEVAQVLGHSSTKMVEQTYGHLYESHLQQKVDALDSILGGAS